MSFPVVISLVGALGALALVVGGAVLKPRSVAHWSFLAGMLVLSLERLCQVYSMNAISLEGMLFWQRRSMLAMSFASPVWLVFSLTFGRGNAEQFLKKWMPVVILFGLAPVGVVIWQWQHLITDALWTPAPGEWVFAIALPGKVLHGTVVASAALILMNLEWTFRATVGASRWKIKYAVIGIALLFGVWIYSSSEIILNSANSVRLIAVNSAALTLSCLLLSVWLYRSRLSPIGVYPSSAALHRSLTLVLAGAYLIVVGLLAKAAGILRGEETFHVEVLFVLTALVGLGLLCLSDRLRAATRRFVSCHFKRPFHDYRRVWSNFTQRTTAVLDRQEFTRTAARLISETFEVLSVSIWLVDESRGDLVLGVSTSLDQEKVATRSLPDDTLRELSKAVGRGAHPVDIDRCTEDWCRHLRESNPNRFRNGGHRFCMPLAYGAEIMGLIVLGDRVRGVPFSAEDLELLRCLGDQIAGSLRSLSLSLKLVEAKELEAFQVMSAFLVHDLKNTASALSLTLRNLPEHFANPAFRDDALRALAKSVERVNDLISRLTALRQKVEISRSQADLNQVVAAARSVVSESPTVTIVQNCRPLPPFLMDPKQIESAVVNLVLNARQAIAHHGEIRIETGRDNGWALITVSDNGCGMDPDFMAHSLFKPFKTTKSDGLGIGMFQTKAIIEAHGGRIAVQSESGKGTTFRVWLPLTTTIGGKAYETDTAHCGR